jgi:rfaE bifunctional protein kinase chain/domain
VGDICLDRWCWYDPALGEPSRETGIPRLGVVRTEVTPGAGGTIANNLVALGVENVSVLGVIGQDGFGWELLRALNARGIASDPMVVSGDVATFTYTKLLNTEGDEEDQPRVDFINTEPLSRDTESQLLERLASSFDGCDVLLVSDQAETSAGGVITPAVRQRINELAAAHPETVVWVDSRMRAELFRHVIVKPNEDEAGAAAHRLFGSDDLQRWRAECSLRALIVTRGERGAEVIDGAGVQAVGTRKVTPVDICGAGDSFSAGAACALHVTGSPVEAARFGNLVASVTVTKKGTGTASPQELIEAAGR